MTVKKTFLILLFIVFQTLSCLPVINEKEMDLSDFQEFEIYGDGEPHYIISCQEDGSFLFTVRSADEFVMDRILNNDELDQVRSASKKITLRTILDDGEIGSYEPGSYFAIRWDDIQADTWRGYYLEYAIDYKITDDFFEMMETFRKAGSS